MSEGKRERIPVLYLAPWVDYGGSDKNTIDWFRWLDRDRFAPSLVTTQPSPNRLISEVAPFAEETWVLPELMPAEDMPRFIFDFLHSREVRVLHLMNSRLGFELLPDLACLPHPPAVVVQLHAEEVDRSGYVRYVSTRFGEFVDRFSMSNRHVAGAVEEYGVPAEKVRVIYTGIDPDDEFSPDRAKPVAELPGDRLQILFAARLVAQKDPLLMLDVAAAMRERGVSFQIHVVGEGDLEEEMRRRIAAEGLGEHVLLHPPMPGLQPWYAACDVLLMTSTFEGIPIVIFEAMAMGLPVVAPDLPAIGELLGEVDDALVSPRDSVQGYASALARLAEDRARMEARGAQMRARARAQFTVRQMAEGHEALYEELVEAAAVRSKEAGARLAEPRQVPALSLAGLDRAGGSVDDRVFREKILRRFAATGCEIDAIALIDAGPDGRFPLRALAAEEGPPDAVPHTVIWRRAAERDLPHGLPADRDDPAASIARVLAGAGLEVEWRHAAAATGEDEPRGAQEARAESDAEGGAKLQLPGAGAYSVPRWEETPTWLPAQATIAMRYREERGTRRLVGTGPPPAGFAAEHCLGALRSSGFEGTAKLVRAGDEYEVIPREGWDSAPADAEEIGYLELAGFPQMDPLALALHRETGRRILVTVTDDDPLRDEVDLIEGIGYVEPVPARPRQTPPALRSDGLVGLSRAVDEPGRRHHYAIGAVPPGELVGELGGLAEPELGGEIGAWIVKGYLVTERHRPPSRRPRPLAAARWAAEPAAWRGLAAPTARAKVSARRATIAAARLTRAPQPLETASGDPEGWLYESERHGRAPLFAAYHPVSGDQLLTRSPGEAAQLGYDAPELLGYMRRIAPLTGDLHLRPLPIPWARRFGAVPRSG
jgi:glycosyltransferase involved in cell wall biosynthesis